MKLDLWIHSLILAAIASPAAAQEPEAAPRPSFLVILTDDQRFDALGGAGHPCLQTPAMDALANAGVSFRNAFVTTSICAASRASILCSRWEGTHGFSFRTPPLARRFSAESYPGMLRSAGYRTALVGKCGVKFEKGASAELFDRFRPLSPPYLRKGSEVHLSERTGAEAVDFLRSVGSAPFCLSLWFNAPHAEDPNPDQYIWPRALDDLYADAPIPSPPNSTPEFFSGQPEFLRNSLGRKRWFWRFDTPAKRVAMTRGYYRMITGVDRAVARVLAELERLGRAADTVVVFTSDNGYFLGERGLAGKWLPYEESIRIPLIVRDPRLPQEQRGRVRDEVALNVDLAPTLLELAGLTPPAGYQGRSLAPLLAGGEPPWRREFFYEHRTDIAGIPKCEAVRGERWKYVRYYEEEPPYEELYDLQADPGERTNLAAAPGAADALARMRERCHALRARCATGASVPSSLRIANPRCEYRRDPLGIDTAHPRFTWELAGDERGQHTTAYHLLVATAPELLAPGKADLWDSGEVSPPGRSPVAYAGAPLRARQRAFWKVRARDRDGRITPWSAPASFEMALLDERDWSARWIGDGRPVPATPEAFYEDDPAPLLRREFELAGAVQRARLYVCGLGWSEAWINGRRVGENILDPAWTAYGERVLYSTHDVTAMLRTGRNAIGVELGKGWYAPLPLKMWGHLDLRKHLRVGRPRLLAQLEIELADGSRKVVASDANWRWAPGPRLRDSVFLGEVFDARRALPGWSEPEFEASDWQAAVRVEDALGALRCQALPPVRITDRLEARAIHEPEPGVFVFDFGENLTGLVELRVRGPRGTRVQLRFGELLDKEGGLNVRTSTCGQIKGPGRGGPGAPALAWQGDTCVLAGEGLELYRPAFTFHGFRYAELRGFPGRPTRDSLVALRIHSAFDDTLEFACSDERINRLQAVARRTFCSNAIGLQSDCPHRERFGYGGDIVPTAEAFALHFDMAGFYAKVVRDFHDAAGDDGALTMTAPFVGIAYAGFGGRSGPIGWGHAHPLLLRLLLRYHGDRSLAAEQYATARAWVDFIVAHTEDGIVRAGLSDHESLEKRPVAVTSTAFLHEACEILVELAELLVIPEDARRYAALAESTRAAFVREFVDADTGAVGNDTQCALATALYHDLVEPPLRARVLERLETRLAEREGHLATGIFGTHYALESLSRLGRAESAWQAVTAPGFPGWMHMLDQDATTLWETWKRSEDTFSHNHPMFGSVAAWMVRWLAGLAPAPDAVGFDRVLLRPQLVGELRWVRATYRSLRGPVRSAWRRADGRLRLEVELPAGVVGELHLPAICDPSTLRESDRRADGIPGVEILAPHRLQLSAGHYRFDAELR